MPADHPSLAGHFPGRPVLPGVVLLDHVIAAVGGRVAGLPSVKFLRPVMPGDVVEITCGAAEAGRVNFSCRVAAAEVARGSVLLTT